MNRFKTTLLATACLAITAVTPAHAGLVTYSSYSVLNNQTITLNDAKLGINEDAGSGQITLNNSNTPGGMIATWCVDIAHMLQYSGSFDMGRYFDRTDGEKINALLTHVVPTLAANHDNSSALQVAIWKVRYGSDLTVSGNLNVTNLADSYLSKVADGTWAADPTMRVAVLTGRGSNQDQAYLTPVPEPASLAVVATGLIGLGFIRRKRA